MQVGRFLPQDEQRVLAQLYKSGSVVESLTSATTSTDRDPSIAQFLKNLCISSTTKYILRFGSDASPLQTLVCTTTIDRERRGFIESKTVIDLRDYVTSQVTIKKCEDVLRDDSLAESSVNRTKTGAPKRWENARIRKVIMVRPSHAQQVAAVPMQVPFD